jgi:putative tryptophan/tyrosine transport system substrate-binding protein
VRRREFITLLGSVAVAWPLAARAQEKIPRIGYLSLGPATAFASFVEALRAGLSEVGYVDGRNVIIEFRWAASTDELPRFAAELVTMNVDVIFASNSTYVEAARQATSKIPIVFATHADPSPRTLLHILTAEVGTQGEFAATQKNGLILGVLLTLSVRANHSGS